MENEKSKVWDIMVKSDYLTDILEKTPAWIIRWGNTLFLVFIAGLLTLAALIQFPETISARVELVTQRPPVELKAMITGKIDTIFFKEKDLVREGAILARLDAIANYKDVAIAKNAIQNCLLIEDFSAYATAEFPQSLRLGELGSAYNVLLKEFSSFQYFLQQNYVFKKIKSLETEIQKVKLLNESLKKQEALHAREVKLAETDFARSETMHAEGVISNLELENRERELLSLKRVFESTRMNQVNNDLQIERLSIQKDELLNTRSQEINTQINRLKELLSELRDQISQWEKNYLIISPISGELVFATTLLDAAQPVTAGQTVFNLIPIEKNNHFIGICNMPMVNSGEVNVGGLVQVRLDAYPYQEYGTLEARIATIASLSQTDDTQQSFNRVELTFADSLTTSFGKKIIPTQRMTGNALIVKKKRSMLERIFDQLRSLFEK